MKPAILDLMNDSFFDDLPWDNIEEISERGIFEVVFKKIPKKTFEFVLKEENRERLVSSALKSLKKKNHDTTYEQAVALVNLMQTFARKALEWNKT